MFTVITATCNRPDRLQTALACTEASIAADPAGGHAIIVVDNGSDRLAEDAVKCMAAVTRTPLRYLRSTPFNKAAALNVAIRAAETEWLAFTDDDCTPSEAWLRCARRYATSAGLRVFSGRLQAGKVDFPLPLWLPNGSSPKLPWSPAFVDYAPRTQDGVLDECERVPFGANIFVQKSVFEQFGPYDEDLWQKCGAAALGSEDAEFAIRIRARGLKIGYCHEALVIHPVFPERATASYYLKHIYHFGVREPCFAEPGAKAAYLYLLKRGVTSLFRCLRARCRGDRVGAMREFMEATRDWGEIVGWLRSARCGPTI